MLVVRGIEIIEVQEAKTEGAYHAYHRYAWHISYMHDTFVIMLYCRPSLIPQHFHHSTHHTALPLPSLITQHFHSHHTSYIISITALIIRHFLHSTFKVPDAPVNNKTTSSPVTTPLWHIPKAFQLRYPPLPQ